MPLSIQRLVLERAPRYREATHAAIKEAILVGGFEPGQPLIEEQIADSLQVSRTPVREALAILEHEGLIAPRNGRGLYVREMTREEFLALFVANEAVEPFLVRRASRLASEDQLREMGAAVDRGEQCANAPDTAGFLRSGRDFHRLVGLASGNVPLTEFVVRNEERTDLYLLGYGTVFDTSKMAASNREHRAILSAIARRDPEEAVRLVIVHSQLLRERLVSLFDDGDEVLDAPEAMSSVSVGNC